MIVRRFLLPCRRQYTSLGTADAQAARPRRSYLYVPSSSERMLQKSLGTKSDVIIYDLEDSVAPSQKNLAREGLLHLLNMKMQNTETGPGPDPARIAVRLNDISTPFFRDDLVAVLQSPLVRTLVMPKIHSPQDLDLLSEETTRILQSTSSQSDRTRKEPLRIIASIESARALWHVGDIAGWMSKDGSAAGCVLTALLFAAEDYCADTSIIRTLSRRELLYTRSKIVAAAKAFGLEAIDMVCVNYKDTDYLRDECEDARKLGYNGKQAIHPDQVDIIHRTFLPTDKEILRAAKILHQMEQSHQSNRGAFGLEVSDGKGKEMIDAPMLKQAQNVIRVAQAAGMEIPRL